jgi:hypothetical protein
VQNAESILVSAGERQVLEYRHVPSPYKPYASRLFSPSGVQVLRDSPADHKHHHALMFAVAARNVNFWEENAGAGVQRPRSVTVSEAVSRGGMQRAGFTQLLDWINPRNNRAILEETRIVEVMAADDLEATLLTWTSQLKSAGNDPVTLTGSHYFGLGMRFVETMDRGGVFFNAERLQGEVVRGSEQLTPSRWCAYTAPAGEGQVTVAVFDHPANPRHPNRIFTMTTPFAYLAATLNLWKEPLAIAPRTPAGFTFGVAVWDGIVEPERMEALYRRWAR